MGSNSLSAIDHSSVPVGYCSCIHSTPHHAPQPKDPEASVYKWISWSIEGQFSIMATTFHESRKQCHHHRSDLNEAFSRTNCCLFPIPLSSSNTLRRKVLPGRTTLQACFSLPANDCSSFTLQAFFGNHSATSCCSSVSFPTGNRLIIIDVSSSIPKKVSETVGPINLSSAIGTPSLLNTCSNFAALSRTVVTLVARRLENHPRSETPVAHPLISSANPAHLPLL